MQTQRLGSDVLHAAGAGNTAHLARPPPTCSVVEGDQLTPSPVPGQTGDEALPDGDALGAGTSARSRGRRRSAPGRRLRPRSRASSRKASNTCEASRCQSGPERRNMSAGISPCSVQKLKRAPDTPRVARPRFDGLRRRRDAVGATADHDQHCGPVRSMSGNDMTDEIAQGFSLSRSGRFAGPGQPMACDYRVLPEPMTSRYGDNARYHVPGTSNPLSRPALRPSPYDGGVGARCQGTMTWLHCQASSVSLVSRTPATRPSSSIQKSFSMSSDCRGFRHHHCTSAASQRRVRGSARRSALQQLGRRQY